MDVLIIKKEKRLHITKHFGRIFQTHNIFEYKSETDSLSISDYHKVLAYGLLYSSFEQIPLKDITLSFVLTRHPRELVKYLEQERKLTVKDMNHGVSYIYGEIVPIQILERKKLSRDDNIFIRNLGSRLSVEDLVATLRVYKEQKLLNEKNVYLNRIIEANKMSLREVVNMSTALELLWEAADETGCLEDLKKHIAEQSKIEGKIEDAFNIIREFNTTVAKAMLVTNLPENEKETLITMLKQHNIPYTL